MAKRTRNETDEPADVEMEEEIVNVDFDFFDVVEDDFLSIKHLVRQLFDVDNVEFDLSTLAQTIIDAGVGITIKTEGAEGDPFALFSVVDAVKLKDSKLFEYWIAQTSDSDTPVLNRTLRKLFSAKNTDSVGILFSERLLNMPLEIVKPLYTILANELSEKGVSYDYLVIPSKAYTEQVSELEEPEQPAKKGSAGPETLYFHPEDELIGKRAVSQGSFALKTKIDQTDSRRAFSDYGILPQGLLTIAKFGDLAGITESLDALTQE